MTQEQIINQIKKTPIKDVADNPLFLYMTQSVKRMVEKMGSNIEIEEDEIVTAVTVKNKTVCTRHNFLYVELPDGSHIRFAPKNEKDVEITRIISNTKGYGKLLMTLVLTAYSNSKLHDIDGSLVLECTGSVGLGKNKRDSSISEQSAFFRIFGFRMVGKYNPSYIKMKLTKLDDFKAFQETMKTYLEIVSSQNK